ncbi:MAG: hypothetical protein QW743_03555 [Candidatus Methanomethylicia archaeon]
MEDMKMIFSDFDVKVLKRDHEAPGIFLKAVKPAKWEPTDLSNIALYSMILGRRTKAIPDTFDMPFLKKAILSIREHKLWKILKMRVAAPFNT